MKTLCVVNVRIRPSASSATRTPSSFVRRTRIKSDFGFWISDVGLTMWRLRLNNADQARFCIIDFELAVRRIRLHYAAQGRFQVLDCHKYGGEYAYGQC